LAAILKWTDQFDAARSRLVRAHQRAVELADESSLPYVCYHLGELECWAGNWKLAAGYAEEGCQAAERTGQDEVRTSTLYVRALVEAHRGEVAAAHSDAEESLRLCERTGTTPVMLLSLSVLGFLAISTGDPAGAHERLGPLTQFLAVMGTLEPAVVHYVPDEIEALLALGELDQAEALLDSFQERARALDRTWALATGARCRGLLLAARGDLPTGLAALDEALEQHQRLAQPFELGRTLLVQGNVRRRARQKRGAAESLGEALRIFGELGAPLWAEKVRAELARIGGRAPSPVELTPTEAKMAELVAAGHTNQEVADLLFVSIKTVESGLSRVYRKLGVGSRRQLARRLRSEAGPDR
jgi:DNA-binding CsgD family transcriptional regulator